MCLPSTGQSVSVDLVLTVVMDAMTFQNDTKVSAYIGYPSSHLTC